MGLTITIKGKQGSGKSNMAYSLAQFLKTQGKEVFVLDSEEHETASSDKQYSDMSTVRAYGKDGPKKNTVAIVVSNRD